MGSLLVRCLSLVVVWFVCWVLSVVWICLRCLIIGFGDCGMLSGIGLVVIVLVLVDRESMVWFGLSESLVIWS